MDFLSRWWAHWAFLAIAIAAVIVVEWGLHGLLLLRLRRLDPQRDIWHQGLLSALGGPVHAAVWLVGAIVVKYRWFGADRNHIVNQLYAPTLGIIVTLLVAWFLLRAVGRIRQNYSAADAARSRIDFTTVDAVSKLAVVVVLAIATLSILQRLGVSIGGLLAFGGATGVAIGFAAQTLVANLLGGFTVFVSHVFKINEDIILPGTEVAGTVKDIGWRATRVMNWNGQPIYVPNAEFNKALVVNWSRMRHRTISESVYLRYTDLDKVAGIVAEVNPLLEARQDIGYFVFRFDSFSERALKLCLYAYADTTAYATYMQIKEEILLAIADIARRHGANLVLPVANVYMPQADRNGPAAVPDALGRPPAPGPDARVQGEPA